MENGRKFISSKDGQLLTILFLPALIYYGNFIFKLLGMNGYMSYVYGLLLIYSTYIILSAIFYWKNSRAAIFVIVVSFFIFLAFSLHDNGRYIIGKEGLSLYTFLTSDLGSFYNLIMPLWVLFFNGVRLECVFEKSIWISRFIVILQIVIFLFAQSIGAFALLSEDYMSFAYYGLLPVVVLFYNRRGSLLNAILFGIGVFSIIIIGSRGALMTMVLFLLLYYILKPLIIGERTTALILILLFVSIFLVVDFNSILNSINTQLESIGFTSRTLTKYLSGVDDFSASSERDEITLLARQNLKVLPDGLWGDRQYSDVYVHNWILEILLDAGIVFGAFIICYVIFLNIRAIICTKKSRNLGYLVMLCFGISLVWIKFMVSSSFLLDSNFSLALIMFLYVANDKTYAEASYKAIS